MSGNVERSRTRAACSTVAGVLIASAEVVSSAAWFFDPHPKRQPITHTAKTFFITVREQRQIMLSIAHDHICDDRLDSSAILLRHSYFLLLTLLTGPFPAPCFRRLGLRFCNLNITWKLSRFVREGV